jgi:hypothetical protein
MWMEELYSVLWAEQSVVHPSFHLGIKTSSYWNIVFDETKKMEYFQSIKVAD